MITNNSERGQALVLLVLGVVVLLGFTALAVDGGMVYSDRRNAQMGSDAASLAGGGEAALQMENRGVHYNNFDCGSSALSATMSAAETAAVERASNNNYVLDLDVSDKNGVDAVCGIEGYDKYVDIKTWVTADTETSFMHFVFSGIARNTVEAITRVRPRSPAAYGHAIVALNPADCQGQQNGAGFHGSVDIDVDGGGIFSNGCLQADGNPDVDVMNGDINYAGEVDNPEQFDPEPSQVDPLPPSSYYIPPPDCTHADAWSGNGSQLEALSPLEPGLYCVTGDLRLNGNGSFEGTGVTIVMVDGDLVINGTVEVNITAPAADPDPAPAIPGVVIYAPPSNDNEIQLNGTSDSYFEGTVYAPGANINLLGTGGEEMYHTQLIGWNVEVGGTNDARIVFNPNQLYSRPAAIELYK